MLTSRTARWAAGTALLCVALLAVSWLLLVSPRRAEAAELRDQNVATQTQNDLLEVKIAQLRSQFARLPESQAELADILAQMPADAGMPRLVRDLDAMAKESGVELTSLTPGAAQPLVLDAAGAGAAAAGTAPAGSAPAGAAAGSAPGVAGATTGAAATASVVSVPVTLVVSGDYFQTVAFLKQLQTKMPRAFLVTTVQMAASGAGTSSGSATGGQVQVTVTGSVFALPGMSADALSTGSAAGASATAKSPMAGGATPAPSATTTAPAVEPSAGAGATATASPSATPSREDS
ncbi:MAG: type 4a pilus biogenesis protein PilO [Kineosporiaceae bacterium]